MVAPTRLWMAVRTPPVFCDPHQRRQGRQEGADDGGDAKVHGNGIRAAMSSHTEATTCSQAVPRPRLPRTRYRQPGKRFPSTLGARQRQHRGNQCTSHHVVATSKRGED